MNQVVAAGTEVEVAREKVYTMERLFATLQKSYSDALYEFESLRKQLEAYSDAGTES